MTLQDITAATHNFTDEMHSEAMILNYVNEAISVINSQIGIELPEMKFEGHYNGFKADFWVTALFVPYASYGVKMNDGSLEEAMIYLDNFNNQLERLGKNVHKAVESEYLGDRKTRVMVIPFKNRWL